MKKIVLLFAAAVVAATSLADSHKVYCELLGTQKGLVGSKATVTVDFGQEQNVWKGNDQRLVDEDGKDIVFNSMVDAMNYMGEFGWNFEQAYVVSNGSQNVLHWLLSKDLEDGEDIMDGFNTRESYKAGHPVNKYALQFYKKKVNDEDWELAKEQTKKLTEAELQNVVKEWESKTNDKVEYKCSYMKIK